MNNNLPTILLVDDDPRILSAYKRNLADRYNMLSASNAQEGLILLKQCSNIAVIVSDYRMPGKNGLDFLAEACQTRPDITTIMLTGFGDFQVAVDAVNRCRIFRFLSKPCPTAMLIEAVDEALKARKYKPSELLEADSNIYVVSSLLTALAERDQITEGHSDRVTELTYIIGLEIGLSENQLVELGYFSQLHDIGKLAIPDKILFNPNPLTTDEWAVMRRHCEKGSQIVRSTPGLSGIADFILKHHEHFDGKGYPLGLQGKEIPLECRILSVVDAYDVMTHDRPYRASVSKTLALNELRRCSGSQFDPGIVKLFLDLFA